MRALRIKRFTGPAIEGDDFDAACNGAMAQLRQAQIQDKTRTAVEFWGDHWRLMHRLQELLHQEEHASKARPPA